MFRKEQSPSTSRLNEPENPFAFTTEDLQKIVNFDNRNKKEESLTNLRNAGGLQGVAKGLNTNLEKGLCDDLSFTPQLKPSKSQHTVISLHQDEDKDLLQLNERKKIYGENIIRPSPPKSIFTMIWENILNDTIIQILIIGAIVTLVIGTVLHPANGWLDGLAIVVAVVIVLGVTAINDYSKEKKFRTLMLMQTDKRVKVIRNGQKNEISSWDSVVGDLIEIVAGDEIPADGLLVHGNNIIVDESPLTGESKPVKKHSEHPFMFSGCQASEGMCVMLVTAVGVNSSAGQIQDLLNESNSEETPLQKKLDYLGVQIGKLGMAAGILTFVGLLGRWGYDYHRLLQSGTTPYSAGEIALLVVKFFVTGVTVIVVAVPEGLPLAVTVALAFSMFKMIKDKCFVRHLSASETMGEATCICTDKTGTLTENRMKVVRFFANDISIAGDGSGDPDQTPFSPYSLPEKFKDLVTEGICLNSTCFIKGSEKDGSPIFVGSATEGALLIFSKSLGIEYERMRQKVKFVENGELAFSSNLKRMATMIFPSVELPLQKAKHRSHCKGASEIMLGLCSKMINPHTLSLSEFTDEFKENARENIKSWSAEGLRTLILAFRDTDDDPILNEDTGQPENLDQDLTFISLVGIKDPIRKEVPEAVKQCQRAGMVVRMVTGDNIFTANKIAKECHILTDYGVSLEGPEFRAMSQDDRKKIIPKLQVLARSSPSDKFILVSLLKEMGEIVAVTGDGTNDAPALKEADVGFAMGLSGTQIAMNACDIILTDDNFASIVNSIKWGRNVLQVIRRFLQFQLAVNLAAIIIVFLGSVTTEADESPFSTVQLLWINLIMDSFGAIALASEDPEDNILHQRPHRKKERLINVKMMEYIFVIVIYQVFAGIFTLLNGYTLVNIDSTDYLGIHSLLFTTFVFLQITNEITCRQLQHELNIFKGMVKNYIFLGILALIIGVQIIIVQFGSDFIQTRPLNGYEWLYAIVFALGQIVFVLLARILIKLYNKGAFFLRRRRVTPVHTPISMDQQE